MKKIALISLLIFFSISFFGQNVVTKVIGKIKKSDSTVVRIGTKLSEKETLLFSSKQNSIRMIVSGKGTFIVSPNKSAVKKDNVWTQVISTCTKVKGSAASLNSRAQLYEKIPDAFKTMENVNQLILISNSKPNQYLFNAADYDLANGGQFIIQIEQEKKQNIQLLRTSNDTLLLYRSDFQLDEMKGSKQVKYTIGFYNKTKNITTALAEIKPYFDDAGEMEAILYTLIDGNKTKSATTQKELCYNEVYKALGKPSDILFYSTFDQILQEINNPVLINTTHKKGLKEDIESYEKIAKLPANVMRNQIDLPAQFSLRQYTPQVQSQGDYGTCVAWSSAYAARTIAWSVRNNYNNIDNAASISKYSFSPQFLFLNIKAEEDAHCESGSTLESALKFIQDKGVIAWDNSAYNCTAVYTEDDKKNALSYKIHDFQRLSSWFKINDSVIVDMKRSIAEKKTLLVGMHLPASFNNVDTKTGIWYPEPSDYIGTIKAKNFSGKYSGHAMCIIGYSDAVNGGSFEIMNSWGKNSGKDGFYWISYDDIKKFGSQVLIMKDIE